MGRQRSSVCLSLVQIYLFSCWEIWPFWLERSWKQSSPRIWLTCFREWWILSQELIFFWRNTVEEFLVQRPARQMNGLRWHPLCGGQIIPTQLRHLFAEGNWVCVHWLGKDIFSCALKIIVCYEVITRQIKRLRIIFLSAENPWSRSFGGMRPPSYQWDGHTWNQVFDFVHARTEVVHSSELS